MPASLMDRVALALAQQEDDNAYGGQVRHPGSPGQVPHMHQQHCSPKPYPGPTVPASSSGAAAAGSGKQGLYDGSNAATSSHPPTSNATDAAVLR